VIRIMVVAPRRYPLQAIRVSGRRFQLAESWRPAAGQAGGSGRRGPPRVVNDVANDVGQGLMRPAPPPSAIGNLVVTPHPVRIMGMGSPFGAQHRHRSLAHDGGAALIVELALRHRRDDPVAGFGRRLTGDVDRSGRCREHPGDGPRPRSAGSAPRGARAGRSVRTSVPVRTVREPPAGM